MSSKSSISLKPTGAPKKLLKINDISLQAIQKIFERAKLYKAANQQPKTQPSKVAALVFFEPSTRTRMSFEIAAHRLNLRTSIFTADATTSLSKGESHHETLNNIIAMEPDLLIVRSPENQKIDKILLETKIPTINAGNGKEEHPSQALLDAFTVLENRGTIQGEKILFVGDVSHSRVAGSGRILFEKLGAEVAICSPKKLMPQSAEWKGVQRFEDLSTALKWCTVCIGLRIQSERHSKKSLPKDYISKYRLDAKNLNALGAKAIILHPGPFVNKIDLDEEILKDSRCKIHDQVTNGVYIRMAIMEEVLGATGT